MKLLEKYAKLLAGYCLELKEGEKLLVRSTFLAEPLLMEIHRECANLGVWVEYDLAFREKGKIFMDHARENLITQEPVFYKKGIEEFDSFLVVRAPYNLREDQNIDSVKRIKRQTALQDIYDTYSKRTANRDLKRSLCQFPTEAAAQEAGMSLSEYEDFVYNACHLYADEPEKEWLEIRSSQQRIVDLLNKKDVIQYKSEKTNISFSVKNRIWINSDGQNNMPSGEVFTGPVEDSVNGIVHFDYPAIFMGKEVKGITLWVENGEVKKWEAEVGNQLLDEVFAIEGSRYFGEVAIGTNYNIQQATKNILFDEKIGGTIHMAVGQSYIQTGGKNKSPIHWDMISNMKNGGEIWADQEKIYENGKFVF